MIFLKRFLKIAIWIFIGSCFWVMAAFFGSNYTIEIFVQETRRSSFEKLNLFGSIGKIFNTEQEWLIYITYLNSPGCYRLCGSSQLAFVGCGRFLSSVDAI